MTSVTTASTAASSAATANSTTGSATSGQSALASLTDNYQTFLTMLTTQLQNQDPSSPMDSNQFTSELVQFSGVEQQIATNSDLSQMIALMQGNNVLQSSQILGKSVQAASSQLPVQGGTGQLAFTAPSAGPVAISLTNGQGQTVYSTTLAATQGLNTWTWNGQTAAGTTVPDGNYGVTVNAVAADGTASPLSFTVQGTATAVQQQGSTVQVILGTLPVNMSAVTGVGN